ncbi:MAG: type I secretion system permease/ATPase [bacterium]|jgi:ATP-binding cassette subfamily C exporter for protease/lipase|nr:type I secretion system permease/ATPase [Betaproteobacteria bacterium]
MAYSQPSPGTDPDARSPRRGELGSILASLRGVVGALALFSCAVNLLLLTPSIYMLQVYDRVLTSRNEVTLAVLTLIVVGLFMLEAMLEFVRSRVLVRAGTAFDLKVGSRVFDASFERHLRQRGGNPAQALGDLANVRQFATSQGLFAFFDAPWTPIYIGVIFLLSPWMGLFALVAAVLLTLVALATARWTTPPLLQATQLAAAAANYAGSNLRSAEAIEAMGMLGRVRERWFERQAGFLSWQALASDRAASLNALARFLRLTLQSGILGLGALLVLENQMTPGGMIAASILLGRALAPVELAISAWRGFEAARDSYGRLSELLAAHPARPPALALPRPAGDVAAERLVVAAPGSREPILKGLSFAVPAGTFTAVIGPSGSGKSSLARALVGVWAPMEGALRLDGAAVHEWDKSRLGPWIGYLPQDVELLEGTIAENIARFGDVDSTAVVEAARRAGVHELVLRFPQGYDTRIGPEGGVLSGGQRQRIALARALYGDPALVVMDEPNSNLDDAGEVALLEALQGLKERRRTTFVITHRVGVLRAADRVVVMVDGTIKAQGPRDAVLASMLRKPDAGAPSGTPS